MNNEVTIHPLLENKFRFYLYIAVWLLFALAFILMMKPVLQDGEIYLILDGVLISVLNAIAGFYLYYAFKYGLHAVSNTSQKAINYIALMVLFVSTVVGFDYLVMSQSAPVEQVEAVKVVVPIKIVITLLIFWIYVLAYQLYLEKEETLQKAEETTEQEDEKKDEGESFEKLDRIVVKTGQKIQVIPIEDIFYFRAEKDYVVIYTEKSKYLKEQTMKSLEEQLPGEKFVRVHRSSIVNIERISRIELYEKQSQILILNNGSQVRMSQNGYKLLRNTLNL